MGSKDDEGKSKTETKPTRPESDPMTATSQDDSKDDDGKTKRYSDKRKEERLKREKEKAEKKRREAGIITIEDDSSRDDVTEGTSLASSEVVTIDTASDSAESDKKEKKKSYRERRED